MNRVTRTAGWGSVGIGLIWAGGWGAVFIPGLLRRDPGSIWEVLLIIGIVSLFALPGVLCVVFGIRLLKHATAENIRNTIGSLAVPLALISAMTLSLQFPDGEGGVSSVVLSGSMLIGSLFAVAVYGVVAGWLIRVEGLDVSRRVPIAGRLAAFLLSLQICILGFDLLEEYAPGREASQRLTETTWGRIGFPATLLFAWLSYKGFMRLFRGTIPVEPKRNHDAKDTPEPS